jgi:putative FmdB family regulatory protein
MPTYEYRCKSCGEHLEVVQSFKDDPLTECPACGGRLRKVFGNIGIAFKGSGFYKNDSRTAAKSGAMAGSASSSSDGASKSSADSTKSSSDSPKPSSDSGKSSSDSGKSSSGSDSGSGSGSGKAAAAS